MQTVIECLKGVNNLLLHQVIAVLMVYSMWTPIFTLPTTLAWHVGLCTVGTFPLLIEGLAVLGYDLIYAIELETGVRRIIHAGLMSVGVIFIVAGVSIQIDNQIDSDFQSSHGALGLSCTIFILLSFCLGFAAQFSSKLKGYAREEVYLLVHNVMGIVATILAIASITTGYDTCVFNDSMYDSKVAAKVLASLLIPWCLSYSFYKLYKHIAKLIN